MKIDRSMVSEVTPHVFVTEASTLRCRPGVFPTVIDTDMGNGCRLLLTRRREDGAHVYTQLLGCLVLIVHND